jgi:hypothetical protein
MRDWRSELRDSDPGVEAEMSAVDVQRVRTTVMSAAADAAGTARSFGWPRPFVVATAALSLTCAVALVALQQNVSEIRRAPAVESEAAASDAGTVADSDRAQKQQLQFATPGGTRIIWVFDSEFDIKGTLP